MGQKKKDRTRQWMQQQLAKNTDAHVKNLREVWINKQKETPEGGQDSKLEKINDETKNVDKEEA